MVVQEYLQAAPTWIFLLSLAMLAIFSALALEQVFHYLRAARFIEDTPTSKIRSASQGYTELTGIAQQLPLHDYRAPLTFKPCVWYSYKVEQLTKRVTNGRMESRWEDVIGGTSPNLFLVMDDTGECAVSPLGAQVMTKHELTWEANQLPDHLHMPHRPNQHFRFTEAHIEPGDDLYVLGHFETVRASTTVFQPEEYQQTTPAPAEPVHKQTGFRYHFIPQPKEVQQANQNWQKYQSFNSDINLNLIRDLPEHKHPYLISNLPQGRLTRRYRWRACQQLALFVVTTGLLVGLVVLRYRAGT